MEEKRVFHVNGYLGLLVALLLLVGGGWGIYQGHNFLGALLILIALLAGSSLTIVQPNTAKVLTFFGSYVGTIRDAGLFLTIPLTNKEPVSLRVRNFNSQVLKVNDLKGNPIEIAAVIVFKVVDTAQALYAVDDYEAFVEIQAESAIRHVASEYPYDTFEDEAALNLRGNLNEVSAKLTAELQARLAVAGVKVIETRLTHLAYATEIASAMLQKQQSAAILAARQTIVAGAVSIVEDALQQLTRETDLQLSPEQRLTIINNLLVAIVSERGSQPVIETGQR